MTGFLTPKSSKTRKSGRTAHRGATSVVKSSNISAAAAIPYAVSQLTKRLSAVEIAAHVPVVVDLKDAKEPSPFLLTMKKHGLDHRQRFSKNAPLRVRVVDRVTTLSGTATVMTTVTSLTPLNNADCKVFATVYDEARCTGFTLMLTYSCVTSGGGPTGPGLAGHFGVAYDPANAGVYASVAQSMEASYHLGPVNFGCTQNVGGPYPVGHVMTMHVKVPKTVDPGLVTDLLGSNWVSASDTSVLVGYIKPYAESAGAGVQIRLDYFIRYDMEFAFRT